MKNRRSSLACTISRVVAEALMVGAFAMVAMAQSGSAAGAQFGRMPLLMPDDFSLLHLVAWRVEPAKLDPENPLLEGDMPWDSGGTGIHGSVFKDPMNGKWKAYLVCTTPEEPSTDWSKPWASEQGRKRRLCLYESADGVRWTRPALSFVPFGDHQTTNILSRLDQGTSAYSSIFTDPADHLAPYKMYLLREASLEGDPPAKEGGYYLYHSRDGYKWDYDGGPITDPMKGDLSFFYHVKPDEYVAYYRLGGIRQPKDHLPPYEDGARRSIYRATSKDGKTWTKDASMELTADELDHRDTQYQELVPISVPGGFLATVTMYHPLSQTQDVRVAASHDGSQWWFPDRRPVVGNSPLGDYGGGMIWQSQNLIVENNRLYMYYGASEGTHRQISDSLAPSTQVAYLQLVINEGGHFLPFNTALCRASWDYDRLYALISSAGGPTIGTAVTKSQELAGKELSVNIFTRPAKKSSIAGFDEGFLQVELLDANDKPIPGFSRQDCTTLKGDHHSLAVKWAGGNRAPKQATKAKFYLKRVFLYGFQFKD